MDPEEQEIEIHSKCEEETKPKCDITKPPCKPVTPCTPRIRNIQTDIGITVYPYEKVKELTDEEKKILKLKDLIEFYDSFTSWRLKVLAKPLERLLTPKYESTLTESASFSKKAPPLSPECSFYASQLSKPQLRHMMQTLSEYKTVLNEEHRESLKRTISQTWNTIYNFYHKAEKERENRLKKNVKVVKLSPSKLAEREKEIEEFLKVLAEPKKIFEPEPLPKQPHRPIDLDLLNELATPVYRPELPTNPPGVAKSALTYEITETVAALAQQPKRFALIEPPITLPRKITRGALRYQITDRLLELSKHVEKSSTESDFNPQAYLISKNALRYKATPRIIELAKPKEYD